MINNYIYIYVPDSKKHPFKSRVIKAISILRAACLFILILFHASCTKFLDKKQDKRTTTISSIEELQYLLDNNGIINTYYSAIEIVQADEYFETPENLSYANTSTQIPDYIWNNLNTGTTKWGRPYQIVFQADFVLDELEKFERNNINKSNYDNLKGQALFFRAFAFYHIAQTFCRPYSATASSDLGIALRLTSDINVKSIRSTVQETYDRILADLKSAADLLPETNIAITRPNKCAAYAALARVCLSMRDYTNAGNYANSALERKSVLMDYNTLNAGSTTPIDRFNPENIFLCWMEESFSLVTPDNHNIDTNLYRSYSSDDLRKSIFFQLNGAKYYYFKGSYGAGAAGIGSAYYFYGLATDEMFLIRAEYYARAGNVSAAMADLNTLMIKRWKNNGSWNPFTATNATEALNQILAERKKELVFRGLRWSDLRRLNLEDANITLTRVVNGTTYALPPNDLRWVYLIPVEVIQFTGMEQNPR